MVSKALNRLAPVRTARIVGRLVRRSLKKAGAAPGTLVHTGERRVEEVRICAIEYDGDSFSEREISPDASLSREAMGASPSSKKPKAAAPPEAGAAKAPAAGKASPAARIPSGEDGGDGRVTWMNIDGLHDVEWIERLGRELDIHPLVLEDVVSVGQRPKLEEYADSLFIVIRMLAWDPERHQVDQEQVSLIVRPDSVISFQERPGDVLEPVRDRLRGAKGRIRARGADYLTYAILDAIVDGYFDVMEAMGNRIEELEEEVLTGPDRKTILEIHHLRRELLVLRRAVWPVRELMGGLARIENPLVGDVTRTYLRDVYDHAVQIIDTVETLRDILSGLMDLYLNNVSHRTNEIMKVLTIIASIFIPLTFLAGVYGMNFDYMPELGYVWGYPAVLAVMFVLATGMLIYFKRKHWV